MSTRAIDRHDRHHTDRRAGRGRGRPRRAGHGLPRHRRRLRRPGAGRHSRRRGIGPGAGCCRCPSTPTTTPTTCSPPTAGERCSCGSRASPARPGRGRAPRSARWRPYDPPEAQPATRSRASGCGRGFGRGAGGVPAGEPCPWAPERVPDSPTIRPPDPGNPGQGGPVGGRGAVDAAAKSQTITGSPGPCSAAACCRAWRQVTGGRNGHDPGTEEHQRHSGHQDRQRGTDVRRGGHERPHPDPGRGGRPGR